MSGGTIKKMPTHVWIRGEPFTVKFIAVCNTSCYIILQNGSIPSFTVISWSSTNRYSNFATTI